MNERTIKMEKIEYQEEKQKKLYDELKELKITGEYDDKEYYGILKIEYNLQEKKIRLTKGNVYGEPKWTFSSNIKRTGKQCSFNIHILL